MTEEEFKKLKPGDKVRIVKKRVAGMNIAGEMDKWLGTVMTVRKVLVGDVQMEEDKGERKDRGWFWNRQMIEYKVRREDSRIDLLVRDNKTIAERRGKVGIAKCDPRDEFDEAKGAIIAVARLYGYDIVSDKTGKVTLASEERRRSDEAINKLAEEVFGKPLKEMAKDRVQKELAELEARIEKLFHALAPLADKIGTETEAYSLLNLQLGVMRTYANILRRRLAIWKD